jgi:hypothetical protein
MLFGARRLPLAVRRSAFGSSTFEVREAARDRFVDRLQGRGTLALVQLARRRCESIPRHAAGRS